MANHLDANMTEAAATEAGRGSIVASVCANCCFEQLGRP